jgi:NADPH:quinone reductase-like Zn-dependent oxidoreductase
MKQVICTQYGSPEVLKVIETDKPIPKNNQILIKQLASTVNSADIRLRKADPALVRLVFGFTSPKNLVLGNVISGIVEAVGKDVTMYKVGDKVFGLNDDTMGAYSEFVVINETTPLAHKPSNLSFEETASLVFGGHTAQHYLKKANIQQSQKVLIYGASGSVGTSAIQLAKHYGAHVTAVCSPENFELVTRLGADATLDYTTLNFDELKSVFDVVYETVDKSKVSDVSKLLKKNGILILGAVIIKGALEGALFSKIRSLKFIYGVAKANTKDMEQLKSLAQGGIMKPVIYKTYTLDQIVEAHTYVDQGHKKGNVVITIG